MTEQQKYWALLRLSGMKRKHRITFSGWHTALLYKGRCLATRHVPVSPASKDPLFSYASYETCSQEIVDYFNRRPAFPKD